MAHDYDFLILWLQQPAGILESSLQLPPSSGGCRRELVVAKLDRNIPCRLIAWQADIEWLFAVEAPSGGDAMATMCINQPIFRYLPQPQVEGQLWIFEISPESSVGFYQHVLCDIASIDTACQHRIHAQMHHPSDRCTMARQQPIDGCLVSGTGLF